MDDSQSFDAIYSAINESVIFREAMIASNNGLPDWFVPFSCVNAELLERIALELRMVPGGTLVDFACGAGGPGIWLAELTGASLIGVDFSGAAIDAARSLAERRHLADRTRFVVADITATGLVSASATGLVSIDALMFVDPQGVAREIARLLRPGGIVFATATESLLEPFMATLVRDYGPIFEAAGLRVRVHEEWADGDRQQLAPYHALVDRAAALHREIGDSADLLLEEARNGIERHESKTIRTRNVLVVAERSYRSSWLNQWARRR